MNHVSNAWNGCRVKFFSKTFNNVSTVNVRVLVLTKKLTSDNMKQKSLWIKFFLKLFLKSEKLFANIKLQILK